MNATTTPLARPLALVLAVAFLAATVILVLMQLNITVAEPEFHQGDNVLVDNILIRFASEQAAWPQDLAASLLFALGFAAAAALGATLPGLVGGTDGSARLAAVAFVVAGTVGVAGELLYLGIKEVAISSTYCECALRDPQLIARAESLDLVTNAQGWFTDAFAVAFGIGLLALARANGGSVTISSGWRSYTSWLGVAAIAFVIVSRLLGAISSEELDLQLVGLGLVAVVAGILTPIWGYWTARALATS